MPYSTGYFDDTVKAILKRMTLVNVLDIGPGAGKYGQIVQALRQEGSPIASLEAIEIDPAYIEHFKLRDIYDVVQLGDATTLPDVGADAQWDLVILGDVLEHFRKSLGQDLMDFLFYRTKYILLVVPIDFIQGAWDGHAAESHISTWYPEDFARYRASFVKSDPAAGPETHLVLINGLRASSDADFIFARDL
jgi:SAM-dependent methyltransferase